MIMALGFAEIPFTSYKGEILGALMLLAMSLANAWAQVSALPAQIVLTNAAQIRALKPEEAARQLPVHLRGVVLLQGTTAGGASLTIVDETAGIFLEFPPDVSANYSPGDLLEVDGVSDPGKFAPVVRVTKAWKVGVAELPAPRQVTYDELLSGRVDAQWVEISGVVRWIGPSAHYERTSELWLATANGRLSVRLSEEQAAQILVDSEVRLRGLCFYRFNKSRQALNPVFAVPPNEPVAVRTPAPEEPYAVPLRPVASLMQFDPQDSYTHRVRVLGVITHAVPGQGYWLHEEERGLYVRTLQTNRFEVGDKVEVLGFVTRGGYTPGLEDAVVRKVGRSPPPPATRLTGAAQALNHDGDLVALDATIQDQFLALDGRRLILRGGTNRFSALLRLSSGMPAPRDWEPGSRVRLMGICAVNAEASGVFTGDMEPQSFEILLRSPADLQILQPPPWWTPKHLIWVLGIAVGVLLLAGAGVTWNHRRRLREQALARARSEAEFAAVWNERNRIARELHDTLAQGLAAISMQLEVVKRTLPADSGGRGALEEARALARSNLAEARNTIWNMRSQALETGDLATALGDILRSLTDDTRIKGELLVRGRVRRLAPVTENDCLRIGQEAITNAAKHANAKRIEVVLEFAERQLQLSVLDDGCGFIQESPPPSAGGFGLMGMRERADQLHGDLTVTSEPGEGTVLTLILPLPGGGGD